MKAALLALALLLTQPFIGLAQTFAPTPHTVTIRLRNGESVTGSFKRADSAGVTVEATGSLRTIKLDDIKAIEFEQPTEAKPRYGVIPWSFPAPGMQSIELEGKRLYKISENVYGEEGTLGDFKTRKVHMPLRIVQLAELAHSQDPDRLPDVDKFLTALAAEWAITKMGGVDHKYLGDGIVFGRRMYIYKLGNDSNVAATVSEDRKVVLLMPAPSEK